VYEELPISAAEAAMALEPVIERLQARGSAVAVCNAFRHVNEPLDIAAVKAAGAARAGSPHQSGSGPSIRRTGCFVLDLDRPLAQEGGASLDTDCFGGGGRAAEIALDEFAALLRMRCPMISCPWRLLDPRTDPAASRFPDAPRNHP